MGVGVVASAATEAADGGGGQGAQRGRRGVAEGMAPTALDNSAVVTGDDVSNRATKHVEWGTFELGRHRTGLV